MQSQELAHIRVLGHQKNADSTGQSFLQHTLLQPLNPLSPTATPEPDWLHVFRSLGATLQGLSLTIFGKSIGEADTAMSETLLVVHSAKSLT